MTARDRLRSEWLRVGNTLRNTLKKPMAHMLFSHVCHPVFCLWSRVLPYYIQPGH